MSVTNSLRDEFRKRFASNCKIFRAPGRVNLIGEHTDYNDGFVMPVAIDFETQVALALTHSGKLSLQSLQEEEAVELRLHESQPQPSYNWTDYIRGVMVQLGCEGINLRGANLLVDGKVPIGAGLSSSAALEVATAIALLAASNGQMKKEEIALLCQRAENEFVGSRCGIMDQFASLFGKAGCALLLDCRSLEVRYLPWPTDVVLVICNTMVKHSIANGEYNQRRAECEAGVEYFARHRPEIKALRDVGLEDLREYGSGLAGVLLRRCRHVIGENARVLKAAEALAASNIESFGQLMGESHRSLKVDFEVSCSELDVMVELAEKIPGTYGARMTGGGFGGCTINLVEENQAQAFRERIAADYHRATGIRPEIYITRAAQGAGPVT